MVDKKKKKRIAMKALRVASSMQSTNLTKVVESADKIDEMFYSKPGGGPAGGGRSRSLAFTIPGQSRIFVVEEELYGKGRDTYPEEAIYALLAHEAGHLSLTPIYMKGDMLEVMAAIHQPERDVRFPLPAVEAFAGDSGNSFRNKYQDSIINYNVVNSDYLDDRPDIKRKMAEGMCYIYDDLFGGVDTSLHVPKVTGSFWLDVSYQSARKVLHDMGVSPYDSEGYKKEDVLEKLEDLDFKFSEYNRPRHNKKFAELMWWLRFEYGAAPMTNRLSDSNIRRWVDEEKKSREEVMDNVVVENYAKKLLMNRTPPMPESQIGEDDIDAVRGRARNEMVADYGDFYPNQMDKFASNIGLRFWDDVKDEVLGAGASIP